MAEVDERIAITGYELERDVALASARALLHRLAEVPGATIDALAFGAPGGPLPHEPIRLFEAAHRALTVLGPVLIVVDDLQWIDDTSIALLHYLLRAAATSGQPVASVVASRPGVVAATLFSSLGSVLGPDRFQSMELGPLDREAGVRLVGAVAPRLDDTHAGALWEAASGSPLWLELLATSDDPATDLVRVVSDRLRVLSADEVDVLAVLVVAARPVSVDDIAVIREWPPGRVAPTLPVLEQRGLVRHESGAFAVAHDLTREAVASTRSAEQTRRRRQARCR